jgi:hypothetical protein
LFFRNEVKLSVVWVQVIQIATYVLMLAFTKLALRASRRIGRVQTAIVCSGSGMCLLVTMGVLGFYGVTTEANPDGPGTILVPHTCSCLSRNKSQMLPFSSQVHKYWRMWYVIAPIYCVRTAIMNCHQGLRKSVLMDYVKLPVASCDHVTLSHRVFHTMRRCRKVSGPSGMQWTA